MLEYHTFTKHCASGRQCKVTITEDASGGGFVTLSFNPFPPLESDVNELLDLLRSKHNGDTDDLEDLDDDNEDRKRWQPPVDRSDNGALSRLYLILCAVLENDPMERGWLCYTQDARSKSIGYELLALASLSQDQLEQVRTTYCGAVKVSKPVKGRMQRAASNATGKSSRITECIYAIGNLAAVLYDCVKNGAQWSRNNSMQYCQRIIGLAWLTKKELEGIEGVEDRLMTLGIEQTVVWKPSKEKGQMVARVPRRRRVEIPEPVETRNVLEEDDADD